MSAILPPAERLWWKHPLDRVEGTWIAIAFVWCMVMFFMMIGWHIWGKQNLSTETYRTTAEQYTAKVQAMVDKMDFGSDAEMVDFMRKAENTLAQHLRSGGTTDISDFLAGLPEAALKAATKALGNSRAGSDGDKLLKILTDYLDASRKKAAERQADPTRRASVIDLLT